MNEIVTATETTPRKGAPEYWRMSHPDQEALNEARNAMIARVYLDAADWSVLGARTIKEIEVPFRGDDPWVPAAVRLAKAATDGADSGIVLLHLRTSRCKILKSLPLSEEIFDDDYGLAEGED